MRVLPVMHLPVDLEPLILAFNLATIIEVQSATFLGNLLTINTMNALYSRPYVVLQLYLC